MRVAAADSADRAGTSSIRERKADALNARSLEAGAAQAAAGAAVPTISRGRVTFVDAALAAGRGDFDANLAVFSIADLNARMDANRARSAAQDGHYADHLPVLSRSDYVVHAHSIALFRREIARRSGGGKNATTFCWNTPTATGYVPLEQVDRITRYVGPDGDKPAPDPGSTPPTGRVHTNKARKNAALAFDLVDLYASFVDRRHRLPARHARADRDGGELPLRRDARPAGGHRRH